MDEAVRMVIEKAQEVTRVSILIDRNTRLIVQGITGRDGAFHTQQMLAYGTKVVGGVTPGKGGSADARRAGVRLGRRGRRGARKPTPP